MSKIKKVLAVFLTLAMVLGMGVTTFATDNTSTEKARIQGITAEDGITVTAYQIIKYNDKGYYEEVLKNSITKDGDNLKPSADDVQKLAEKTSELTNKVEITEKDGDDYVTSALTAGTWMIIVTGSSDYLYNPAVISVNQGPNGLVYGELNLVTDTWGTDAYVKKGEPTIIKEAFNADKVEGVQYGDIIQFRITADVPSYTASRENIKYVISDTLDGLSLVVDKDHPVVATLAGADDATLTEAVNNAVLNGKGSFAVDLSNQDDFLKANGTKKIVITYFAKVTTDAKITVDEANNTATLDYSTNDKVQSKSDETYHYTFGIDTTFSGTESEQTNEFIKIDKDGKIDVVDGEVVITGGVALEGAVFQLHIGAADGPLFVAANGKNEFTTDKDGRLEINGLDSDIEYYLIETKAPTGYTLNETPVKVKIDATYDNEGILKSYIVNIGDNQTQYNYNADTKITTVGDPQNPANPYGFKNTKLSALPSTGGIGTTIFTIGGCLIMIIAAALFFASRRKNNK
ncbi:isopeptide-forming domain-containing fimbrial protein [Clostridium sp. AF19-22AC]|uniref:isopeptide-forming domain-containing fimbrial protein n=1 Tax=Clostridia TaxID=186801 RepID=UPI000E4CA625|nr:MULTISPECIES: SpaA isopeptide-forming pilin-related protein [Clostridia]RHR22233.1 isopeptide-forming domain-containing fimbrial protein [Clostridium sp. AF19-22AC]